MSQENKNVADNYPQFIALLILSCIILVDKTPVLFDAFNNIDNYRLVDGWGDGMKDIIYFLLVCITLFTMKFKNNRLDYIVVLIFGVGLILCVSVHGIIKFITMTVLVLALIIYIAGSLFAQNRRAN